jgi:hypothetical protein
LFRNLIELMTPLLRRLRLRSTPHFTTLHNFSLRLDKALRRSRAGAETQISLRRTNKSAENS